MRKRRRKKGRQRRCSQSFIIWNVPRCWSSIEITFGSSNKARDAAKDTTSNSEYRYPSETGYVGRGTLVFLTVIAFRCVHCPIKRVLSSKVVDSLLTFGVVIPMLFVAVSAVVLALY